MRHAATDRLAAIGAVTTGFEDEGDVVVALYVGRDASGHAVTRRLHIPPIAGEDDAALVARLDSRLASQRKAFERANGMPPVVAGPGMTLGHLMVNPPLAWRMRHDHGTRAVDALRETLLVLLEGRGARLSKRPRPYGLVLNANRLDHRETLAPGVEWKGRALVINGTSLPRQVLSGMEGRALTDVVDHDLLRGLSILRAFTDVSSEHGTTTVIEADGEWIRADSV